MVSGVTAIIFGAVGETASRRSADPDLDVDARFPCLLKRRSDDARIDEVVRMLKVWWASPPIPTISHFMKLAI